MQSQGSTPKNMQSQPPRRPTVEQPSPSFNTDEAITLFDENEGHIQGFALSDPEIYLTCMRSVVAGNRRQRSPPTTHCITQPGFEIPKEPELHVPSQPRPKKPSHPFAPITHWDTAHGSGNFAETGLGHSSRRGLEQHQLQPLSQGYAAQQSQPRDERGPQRREEDRCGEHAVEQGEEQKPDQAQADERDRRRSSRERLRRKYLDDIAAEKIALDRCAFDLD